MNRRISEKEWVEEFRDFVSSEGAPVPEELSRSILQRIHAELNPSPWTVFTKLFGIHIVVGTLSLAICDQFGLSPFDTGFSLANYFMRFGHSACMMLCGVLFIGLTVILSRAFLKVDEFRVLSRNAVLQVFGLSIFSLVLFIAFGAQIAAGIGILWLLGAMLGGVAAAKTVGHIPRAA